MNNKLTVPSQCIRCGKDFMARAFYARKGWGILCSRQCLRQWRSERDLQPEAVQKRFWSKVNKTDSCWLWTEGLRGNGYGRFTVGKVGVDRRSVPAHRLVWEWRTGKPVPPELEVCHKCDVRHCVRPEHLFIGTPRDNAVDRELKGRGGKGRAKITYEIAHEIRRQKIAGLSTGMIMAMFSVSRDMVADIMAGKTWVDPHTKFTPPPGSQM